jgi:HSP20 family protein
MKIARCTPAFQFGRTPDFGPWLRHPLAGLPAMAQLFENFLPATAPNRLPTDLYEDADHYHARFEMPGVKKDAVKIELHERVLTITADRRLQEGEAEITHTLSRALTLPDSVQEESITAKLEDGLLTVTLPKQENRKPKIISVH